ncbi:MAG: stage II sporulation protein P, partial [Pygmaiobacter sp.]
MRNKRFRGALTALLCIPLTAAAVLSWTTLRPSASGALRTVAFASTFLAAPKSAVAAMGKVWQLEEGKATPEDPSGGFWTQLPEPPSPPLPPSAASRPEGAGAVVEATYTGKEDARTLFCGTGLVKNVTDLPRAEVERMLAAPLPFQLAANSKEPQILIMHTHATESYQSTKELWYDPAEQSRNTDTAANVVAVGEVLSKTLNDGGIVTLHDATLHDYPSYNGSYARSRATVERYLAEY